MVNTLKFKKNIDWRTKMVNIIKSMIEIQIMGHSERRYRK